MTAVIIFLLVIVFVGVVVKNLFADGRRSGRYTRSDQKSHSATIGKAMADKTNAKLDTAAVIAGAALVHQMRKHHKHDDDKDIDDDRFEALDDFDDLYDHDFYDDLDTQDYEDADYDFQREAYEEEQAAYEDFIYSQDEGYD